MIIDIDEIDLELLRKIEQNNPLNLANERIMVFDSTNEKIYSSDTNGILMISRDLILEVRDKEMIRFNQGSYEICGLFYKSKGSQIIVFTGAIDIFGKRKIKMLRNILILVFTVSLVFIVFAGRLLANRALNPIEKIIQQVDEISISNLDARVNEGNGKDEIAKLAITFNNMLNRLEKAFKIQKTFIANASHELRNPLTVLTGQMEVALMSDRTKKEYHKSLQSAYEDAVNINHLANNLLLLAQTSLESTSPSFERVRIDDILWQATNEMKNRHPKFQISTNFSDSIIDDDTLTVSGNDLLLKVAFLNILENAYKYSENPVVSILVDLRTDYVVIEFKDNGIGIPEKDIDLIFNPFYRSGNSFHIKGHGIGLTLVQNIFVLHHGYVTVSSLVNAGTTFTMHLPLLR